MVNSWPGPARHYLEKEVAPQCATGRRLRSAQRMTTLTRRFRATSAKVVGTPFSDNGASGSWAWRALIPRLVRSRSDACERRPASTLLGART